jgi:Flp pilus assembly protein TadD/TolB-like protein
VPGLPERFILQSNLRVYYYTASKNSSMSPNFMVSISIGRKSLFRSITFLFCVLPLFLPAAVAADQPSVMVFPLESRSDDAVLSWLGEGIAESLTNQLKGAQVRPLERRERIRVIESLDLPPGARLSRGSMIRVAQRAEADLVVLGTYSGTENSLRIGVQVLNIKALKLSGEMVANGPLSALPQMENELAWLILRNNGFEKSSARDKFQERIRKIPNAAYSLYIQSLGVSGEASQIALLLRALQSYRDFPEAQFRLAQIYFRNGDCGGALPRLELARREPGNQVEFEFMRGTCLLLADQYDLAAQAFLQIFQVSRPFEALNNIGVVYLRDGELPSALNALLEAKSTSRTDPTVLLNLSITRHLQGNDSAARTVLEEACKANPKTGILYFMLGFVLKAQGENEKAAAQMAKARSLGVDVSKLQAGDPKMWARVFLNVQDREGRRQGD